MQLEWPCSFRFPFKLTASFVDSFAHFKNGLILIHLVPFTIDKTHLDDRTILTTVDLFLPTLPIAHHQSRMAGKNKSRSLKARGETSLNKYRGSGFEDGFADPPITPMEHAAERQIYDPYVPRCVSELLSKHWLTSGQEAFFP